MAVTHSTVLRDIICNAAVGQLDEGSTDLNGDLEFQSSTGTEVATLELSTTAAGGSSGGTATFNTITSDTSATGGTGAGAVAQFALRDYNNNETILGSVTAVGGGGDATLSSLDVGAGDTVAVSSATYSAPS
jgi:hypothetical protein